jgi:hypothetical protein
MQNGSVHRKCVSIFWKNLIAIGAIFLILLLVDWQFLHSGLDIKLAVLGIISIFTALFSYIRYFHPIKILKSQYYQFLEEMRVIDKRLSEKISKVMRNRIYSDLVDRVRERKEKLVEHKGEMNEFCNNQEFSYNPSYYKQACHFVPVSDNIGLEQDEITILKRELVELTLKAVSETDVEIGNICEMTLHKIEGSINRKVGDLKGFWGKDLSEVEDIVDEYFRKVNSNACLPKVKGFKANTINFFIARPKLWKNILDKAGVKIIDIDTKNEILFGIWGLLQQG